MNNDFYKKGLALVKSIEDGSIVRDFRSNHGVIFSGPYEEKRKNEFHTYLGSASRFLQNKRIQKLLVENSVWI